MREPGNRGAPRNKHARAEDVLFAGAASPGEHGASLLVLRMAEITLVEALTSQQVIVEAERNLAEKLPQVLPVFRLIVSRVSSSCAFAICWPTWL